MRLILAVVVGLAWAGTALAAPIRIELVETLGSIVEFRDGMAGARSSQARSDAALLVRRATIDEKDVPSLAIAVENHGQTAFNLTPSSVRVTTQTGEAVPVHTRDEVRAAVEARVRDRAKWARIAAGMAGAGAAARDQPSAPNRRVMEGPERVEAEAATLFEATQNLGFVAQTVHPGEKHMTDLGLGPLPKDATELTLADETHQFPLHVTRSR